MTRRNVARNLIPLDRASRVAQGEEESLTLADWRERLREDPDGTVAELVRRFGPRRSVAPEVEDLFWRVLVDFGRDADLARAILGRVRAPAAPPEPRLPEAAGRSDADRELPLLDIGREHRVRLRGLLRQAATEAIRDVVRDPEERERTARHPSRLPEIAFARRGRPDVAAALYALEHDHLDPDAAERPGEDPGPAGPPGYRRLCRAALRYEVARALHRVAGHEAVAFDVMRSVVRLVDDALESPGSAAASEWLPLAWRLSFHAREWLGFRYFEDGRYEAAEREFLHAAGSVPETDLAVAARMFAANAMIRDGRSDEARSLLDDLRVDTDRLAPPIADEWVELRERLIAEASGAADGGDEPSD
jgi:hypothetical protein